MSVNLLLLVTTEVAKNDHKVQVNKIQQFETLTSLRTINIGLISTMKLCRLARQVSISFRIK